MVLPMKEDKKFEKNQQNSKFGKELKNGNPPWTKEEDIKLKQAVFNHGTSDWSVIASIHGSMYPNKSRSSENCKERWYGYLDPGLTKQPWTDVEEFEMLLAHRKYQNKWSYVAKEIKGRSNNTIKNKFYTIFRKVKIKIKKSDYNFVSKLEILEIKYIIELMHIYIEHPVDLPDTPGKRGKDYIYSLMQDLTKEDIDKYNSEFERLCCNQVNLRNLWNELAIDLNLLAPNEFLLKLPKPHYILHPELLSQSEKQFIWSQTFQKMCYHPAEIHTLTPIVSPQVYSTEGYTLLSASSPIFGYNGFCNFVNGSRQLNPNFTHIYK